MQSHGQGTSQRRTIYNFTGRYFLLCSQSLEYPAEMAIFKYLRVENVFFLFSEQITQILLKCDALENISKLNFQHFCCWSNFEQMFGWIRRLCALCVAGPDPREQHRVSSEGRAEEQDEATRSSPLRRRPRRPSHQGNNINNN